jgi:uroporphyrinogen decarboxylase
MTKRERVIQAISHKKTDFIPYNIEFTQCEYEKVAAFLGDYSFGDKIGNHISSFFYDGYAIETEQGSGYWKDRFGVVWNRNVDKDIGVIEDIVLKTSSMSGYKFPELEEKTLRRDLETLTNASNDTFRVADVGFTLFEKAWSLRGMENVLIDMIDEPEFINELFDAITDYELKLIDYILKYDIDGFLFGDDWGQQKGLIMGPVNWRKYIKPRMKIMFEKVKNAGKTVLLHSCGDISQILPDLIDIGLDVYQTFQPEIYNIKAAKEEFGKYLSFWGAISTQKLLPFASPEEIKRVIKDTISVLGIGGGYIAAPTHAVPSDVPPENIVAMIEAFQNQVG